MIATSTDRRAAALALARAKLPVLPLLGPNEGDDNQRGKMPRQSGWQQLRNSPEELAGWWERNPDSNVGLVTGALSGLVCIDVDPRNGGGSWLAEHRDRLQEGAEELTGSGGTHLWFVHPGGYVASKRGKVGIAPGVELLADGGHQAVIAPSIHASGGVYSWESEIPLAELRDYGAVLPAWIAVPTAGPEKRQRTRAESYADRPGDVELCRTRLMALAGAVEGQGGDTTTFKAACLGRDHGLSPEAFWPLLCQWNETCAPPWALEELRAKMEHAYSYAKAAAPGQASPAEQFAAVEVAPEAPTSAQLSPEQAAAQMREVVPWMERAVLSSKGVWKDHVSNARLVLENMPQLSQSFRFNLFTEHAEVVPGKAPWRGWPGEADWTDDDGVALAQWITEHVSTQVALTPNTLHQAIRPFARHTRYHPVKDYLDALTWDGVPRLDTWTTRYLGAEDTPYHRAVGARFLIGAVARIYEPGCKLDTMLVLEGRQGTFKSSALRMLFGSDFFSDAVLDVGSKDAAQVIRGLWCVEVAEMTTVRRAEVNELKAFLSRQADRQRDAYGRFAVTHDRQCVFAGTTNSSEYLRDETGGRRFWPVACGGRVDKDAIEADRDQLWAEAETRYAAREQWWLTDDEEVLARAEQDDRLVRDAIVDTIETWLEAQEKNDVSRLGRVTVMTVWEGAFQQPAVALSRPYELKIGAALRALGWEPTRWWDGLRKRRGFIRPTPPDGKGTQKGQSV